MYPQDGLGLILLRLYSMMTCLLLFHLISVMLMILYVFQSRRIKNTFFSACHESIIFGMLSATKVPDMGFTNGIEWDMSRDVTFTFCLDRAFIEKANFHKRAPIREAKQENCKFQGLNVALSSTNINLSS